MRWLWRNGLRITGLVLLVVIIFSIDLEQLQTQFSQANLWLIILAIALYFPHIALKAARWRLLLREMGIEYGFLPSYLSYQGGIFIGLLTPGRLGEFARAGHLTADADVPTGIALSSVLLDRLFDLAALLLVGVAALFTLGIDGNSWAVIIALLMLGLLAAGAFLWDRTFEPIQTMLLRFGRVGRVLVGEDSWLLQARSSMLQMSLSSLFVAGLMTALAYGLFFLQTYIAALAFNLPLDFLTVSFATALGSLVTLLPISISGLGTRDAAIATYLGTQGITTAQALSFSLSIFLIFYLAGGLIGAVCWQLKPINLERVSSDFAKST